MIAFQLRAKNPEVETPTDCFCEHARASFSDRHDARASLAWLLLTHFSCI
jgi:hypothetical protein